jgi:hypothetical protein
MECDGILKSACTKSAGAQVPNIMTIAYSHELESDVGKIKRSRLVREVNCSIHSEMKSSECPEPPIMRGNPVEGAWKPARSKREM